MRSIRIVLCAVMLGLTARYSSAQIFCPLEEQALKPKMVSSVEAFKSLAVLHEGRIKPVDTYARNLLLEFSGRTTFDRRPAVNWLARLLLAPASTMQDKVFLINHPEIPMAIGIEPEDKRRYSFQQLNTGFDKIAQLAKVAEQIEEKNRSVVEHEILRVYHNIVLYTKFSYILTFAFPHPDFQVTDQAIIDRLGLPKDQNNRYSFLDIALSADGLREATKHLERGGPQTWSGTDKTLLQLLANLFQWAQSYHGLPFHIVPGSSPHHEQWMSPWDAANFEFFDPRVRNEITLLRDMTVHYWNGTQLPFDVAARAFGESVKNRLEGKERKAVAKIPLELAYNKADFFWWAKWLYGLAFLAFLLSLLFPHALWRKAACGLIMTGLLLHAAALVMRIVIMSRPPVSTLYETFIFVGFMAVLLGVIIESINKQWLGNVVASVCGLAFLLISAKFSAEGDTLKMLVAVLNSNFWLGTHVLSITTGYAGVCVAGLIGHLYIIQKLIRPKEKKLLNATYRNLVGALLFGLMMAFLGTMLGGIWADQSWGRFWGWDPKENGALLIVIWCAIIFHARIAEMIGPLGMAVMSGAGIIIVMWAWFGVNLLSIGLHSYGFMSGVANSLVIYVVCEVLFLAGSLFIITGRRN